MNADTVSAISTYINNHPLAVLSTVGSDGAPHGTTLYAGSDEQLNVYFMTKTDTTKARNIDANPAVALTFSGEGHQSTLQMSGRAARVQVPDEHAAAFQILGSLRHESKDFRLPITKFEAGPYVVFKVDVEYALLSEYENADQLDGTVRVEYHK